MSPHPANRSTLRSRTDAFAEICRVLRRIGVVGATAAVFLAPLALQASPQPQKHQERASAAMPVFAAAVESGIVHGKHEDRLDRCDPRPWLVTGATCLQAAADDGAERVVRIVTVEHRVGDATSLLERTSLDAVASR